MTPHGIWKRRCSSNLSRQIHQWTKKWVASKRWRGGRTSGVGVPQFIRVAAKFSESSWCVLFTVCANANPWMPHRSRIEMILRIIQHLSFLHLKQILFYKGSSRKVYTCQLLDQSLLSWLFKKRPNSLYCNRSLYVELLIRTYIKITTRLYDSDNINIWSNSHMLNKTFTCTLQQHLQLGPTHLRKKDQI